jgi:hypothetical protein
MARKKNAVRADGRIAVQVYIGRVDGKRKYKTVYGTTQKEADQKADEIRQKLKKGIDIARAEDDFEIWAKRWLRHKKTDVSRNHYVDIESKVSYINSLIGSISLSAIRTADLQDIIDDLAISNAKTGRPTSKKTLSDYKCVMHQILDLAVENRVIDYNAAQYVRIPQNAPKGSRRALSDAEQQWIVDTPHRARTAAMIMMYAGLRRGELIPLQWAAIDFKQRTITINKFVEIISGHPELKEYGKTDASCRTVDIPKRLSDYLENQFAESGASPFELVCPDSNGRMMSESAFRRMWESYIRDLNFKYGNRIDKKGNLAKSKYNKNGVEITIPKFTPHWLRHTFATLLYLSGVDVLTAKEQLGHSDIKTTLSIYTHLDATYKRRSMNKLDTYLDGTNDTCKSDASQ